MQAHDSVGGDLLNLMNGGLRTDENSDRSRVSRGRGHSVISQMLLQLGSESSLSSATDSLSVHPVSISQDSAQELKGQLSSPTAIVTDQ